MKKSIRSFLIATFLALTCGHLVFASDSPLSPQEFQSLKDRAARGNADAQFDLAYRYAEGQSAPKNDNEAVLWYRKAAEQGYAQAKYGLGLMYAQGRGVPQDDAEAVKLYRQAIEGGVVEALNSLANMYVKGRGVAKDYTAALNLWLRAAEKGNALSQLNIGELYNQGMGVNKDYVEAAKWWQRAADQGLSEAQTRLGLCYLAGSGVPLDNIQAYKWFSLAVINGDRSAVHHRDAAAARMTQEQLDKALRLVIDWKPSSKTISQQNSASEIGQVRFVFDSNNIASWNENMQGVLLELTAEGRENLLKITQDNINKKIDFYFGVAPVVSVLINKPMAGGKIQLTLDQERRLRFVPMLPSEKREKAAN